MMLVVAGMTLKMLRVISLRHNHRDDIRLRGYSVDALYIQPVPAILLHIPVMAT